MNFGSGTAQNRTAVLSTLSLLFHRQYTVYALSGINVAPHRDSK